MIDQNHVHHIRSITTPMINARHLVLRKVILILHVLVCLPADAALGVPLIARLRKWFRPGNTTNKEYVRPSKQNQSLNAMPPKWPLHVHLNVKAFIHPSRQKKSLSHINNRPSLMSLRRNPFPELHRKSRIDELACYAQSLLYSCWFLLVLGLV